MLKEQFKICVDLISTKHANPSFLFILVQILVPCTPSVLPGNNSLNVRFTEPVEFCFSSNGGPMTILSNELKLVTFRFSCNGGAVAILSNEFRFASWKCEIFTDSEQKVWYLVYVLLYTYNHFCIIFHCMCTTKNNIPTILYES